MQYRVSALLCLLCALQLLGCRAIRQSVQNKYSIEARRMSREGQAAIHQGRWMDAAELFESALALSNSDDRAFWGYGEVLWHQGDQSGAIRYVEKAVELSGGAPELRVRLGNMYLEVDLIDDAQHQAATVLRSCRDLASAWALHGHVLARKNQLSSSLAAYHRAIAISDDAEVRVAIANIYKTQRRYDRVLATVDPINCDALNVASMAQVDMLRGIALRELGQPQSSHKHLRDAIAQGLASPEVFVELAKTEVLIGHQIEASDALAKALRLDPSNKAALQLASTIQNHRPHDAEEFPEHTTFDR